MNNAAALVLAVLATPGRQRVLEAVAVRLEARARRQGEPPRPEDDTEENARG
jgi:hypothetical protein